MTHANNLRVTDPIDIESGEDIKEEEEIEEDAHLNTKRTKLNRMNAEFFLGLKKKYEENLRSRLEREKVQSMLSAGGKRADKDREKKEI